jgi:hypothetical protein
MEYCVVSPCRRTSVSRRTPFRRRPSGLRTRA